MMASFGQRYPVDPRLSGVISHFYVIATPPDMQSLVQHLSPNLEMMLVFNFGKPVSFSFGDAEIGSHYIDRIGILGPLRRMMNYELTAGADMLVLPFILDGFHRFLTLSPDNLDTAVLEEDRLKAHTEKLDEIWQLLAGIPTAEKRMEALTEYMLLHVAGSPDATRQVLDSIDDIHNPLINPVKVMADRYAVSERAIQLRFKKYTGYSPKELVRFLRFKQVLSYILSHSGEKINWFDLIVQYGYHDQSHLIKDFKYYTGISPQQFVQLNDEGNFCIGRD
jgi:AraC-like DNA-binding protein